MAKTVTEVTYELSKEWGRYSIFMQDAGLKAELDTIVRATSRNWHTSTHKDWNISYIWGINKMKEALGWDEDKTKMGDEEYNEIMQANKVIRKLKK